MMTVLMRQGSKKRNIGDILPLFPRHDIYIEPFFGTGSIFFAKPLARHNLINDYDNEVFNFWRQVKFNKRALLREILFTPISESIIKSDLAQYDDLTRASVFFLKSNCTLLSGGQTMTIDCKTPKLMLQKRIKFVFKKLRHARIANKDFRLFFRSISLFEKSDIKRCFVYSDPPYWQTNGTYNTPKWEWQDVLDCFELTFGSGMNGAMSEFDHPDILALARERGLNVHYLGERRNLHNRRNEILITNYKNHSLFL